MLVLDLNLTTTHEAPHQSELKYQPLLCALKYKQKVSSPETWKTKKKLSDTLHTFFSANVLEHINIKPPF